MLVDHAWSVSFLEDPRQPHLSHTIQLGIGSVLLLEGMLLIRNRDMPEERHLVAVDLETEFAMWLGQRQQEERAKTLLWRHGLTGKVPNCFAFADDTLLPPE